MTGKVANRTSLAAVVCQNGRGHFRRVVGILARVKALSPDVWIDVLCERPIVESMKDWSPARLLLDGVGAQLHPGFLERSVMWSSAETYADGRLIEWEERAAKCGALKTASLVLSDNLAGILSVRSDAVLCGSFLWCEVLGAAYPDDAQVRDFVAHERELLERHAPPMLCVADIAMPAVRELTEAVALPWMCEGPAVPPGTPARPRVAVLDSGTSAASEALLEAGRALAGTSEVELTTPPRSGLGGLAFDYTAEAFAACSVVVCRPGIGAITDCIAQRVPLVLVYESGNIEMSHNAMRLSELGIARDLGPEPSPDRVVSAVRSMLPPQANQAIRRRIAALETDGLDQAARWLVNALSARGHG